MWRMLTSFFFAALMVSAVPAVSSTLTLTGNGCAAGGLTIDGVGTGVCRGSYIGSDSQQNFEGEINSVFSLLGGAVWSELDKSDTNSNVVTADNGSRSGTYTVTSGLTSSSVFVVKSAKCFAAFLYDGLTSGSATGTFDTELAGLLTGNTCEGNSVPALSHLSVYTSTGGSISNPPPVPLPAGVWLMLSGVGALVAARRLKARA